MERIGLVGLGRMGQAIGGRLLAAGHSLVVYNRTAARAAPLLAAGAQRVATPAQVVEHADVVLTILTDDAAVEQVYRGRDGLLSVAATGRLFIEMSTIRTATIRALLAPVLAAGARLVDMPVSGTVAPARQGQLLGLAGGDAADVARALAVVQHCCRRVVHLGPLGAGTTMKLVLNMPMAVFWAALAEALAIGAGHGLQRAAMLEVFLDSPVALPALRAKVPLMLGAAEDVAFDVTGVRKDLLAMTATAQAVAVATPTAAAALAHFAAATAAGYGARDVALIVDYVDEMTRLSRGDSA